MSVAAITIVVVSLNLLVLLGPATVFVHLAIRHAVGKSEGKIEPEGKVQLNVWLRGQITPAEQSQLNDAIHAMPDVAQVVYVSKEQAYPEYLDMFAGNKALTEDLNPSALRASFRIELHTQRMVGAVRSQIAGRPEVSRVDCALSAVDAVKRLLRINVLVRTISLGMTILLLTAAAVLKANRWLIV